MSITVEVNELQLNTSTEYLQMHFLPARISGDGDASVDKFFDSYTCRDSGCLVNSLRGYPLEGEVLNVPRSYKGMVLQETRKPLDDDTNRRLRIKGVFKQFNYWNYDKMPSRSDAYMQALQLIDAADALSQPYSEDDVLQQLRRGSDFLLTKFEEKSTE